MELIPQQFVVTFNEKGEIVQSGLNAQLKLKKSTIQAGFPWPPEGQREELQGFIDEAIKAIKAAEGLSDSAVSSAPQAPSDAPDEPSRSTPPARDVVPDTPATSSPATPGSSLKSTTNRALS